MDWSAPWNTTRMVLYNTALSGLLLVSLLQSEIQTYSIGYLSGSSNAGRNSGVEYGYWQYGGRLRHECYPNGQGQTQTYIAGQINANGGGLTNVLFVNNLTSTNGYFNLVTNGLGQITATFVATNVQGSLVNGAVVASAYATNSGYSTNSGTANQAGYATNGGNIHLLYVAPWGND